MTSVVRGCRYALGLALLALVLPAAAYAQAQGSITGVVRDTSGAVLPGVTVDATSPALTTPRTVVSDGGGQYRFVNLGPGVYAVTFTLPGFSTVVRDGITIAGDFTASINADMRVGAQEETITVTGEAPIVDVQGVHRQTVMTNETVEAVPTGKYFVNLGVLIPGVSASCSAACQGGNSQDTGGDRGDSSATLVAHGSRFRDQRISINNTTVRGSTGYLGVTGPNVEAQQETQIDTSGADASVGTGGVRINVVPKDGGNRFAGSVFFSGTNENFQGSNVDQELKDRGLAGTPGVKKIYDIAPTLGGPIKQDKLWFFLSARRNNAVNYASNLFDNLQKDQTSTPASFIYQPDLTKAAVLGNPLPMAGLRLTWQASARNKIGFSFDYRDRCQCPNLAAGGTAPEAAVNFMFRPQHIALATWASPVTNKLLLEGTAALLVEGWGNRRADAAPDTSLHLYRVTAQNAPQEFRNITTYRDSTGGNWTWYPYRNLGFTATYVTGAHAIKAGIEYDWGWNDRWTTANLGGGGPITSVRLNFASGQPVPNQVSINLGPVRRIDKARYDGGVYIQDKWTYKRLTLGGGLRYDYFNRYTAPVTLGPTALIPTRNIEFPGEQVVNYRDLSPRLGAAWDVFGTGKTAVKVSLNRYVQDLSLLANNGGSVQQNYQDTASRTWTDSNSNFIVECGDLTRIPAINETGTGGDRCGALTGANANLNLSTATSFNDKNTTEGFNHRGYNWEFSASVQQELVPRKVAVDVAFFRRWYGNFTVTDNFAVAGSDYSPFSITVPVDSRLPLSGQTITGFLDLNPNVASLPSDNHVRFASNYGKQTEYWQGMDFSTSIRPINGTLIQGGLSFGGATTDNCEIVAKVPEAATPVVSLTGQPGTIAGPLGSPFCRNEQGNLVQVKALGSYTIPRIDVQVGATFQSINGPQLTAVYTAPAGAGSEVQNTLGRALSGGGSTIDVNLVSPGAIYGDRLHQFDFRLGRVFRFAGNRRLTTSIDMFNMLNGNAVLTQQTSYSTTNTQTWGTPISVQSPRLFKFTVSLNY